MEVTLLNLLNGSYVHRIGILFTNLILLVCVKYFKLPIEVNLNSWYSEGHMLFY